MDGIRNWGSDYGQTVAGSMPSRATEEPAPAKTEAPADNAEYREKAAIGGQLGNIWGSILGT
jgi:hypothetical protein